MNKGAEAEALLPQWLQFTNQNPLDPAGRSEYENYFYQTQIAPMLAQQQADSYAGGQSTGSYAGALMGQLMAQGALSKFQAGLDYSNQLYQNQLQGRASYYAGGPTVAAQQNAADVDRGTNIAQMLMQRAAMENDFNLGSAGMQNNYNLSSAGMRNNYGLGSVGMANNFNLGNYGNALNAYQINQQNQANRFNALTGGLLGIGQGLLGMRRPSFGGGSASGGGATLGSQFGMGGALGSLGVNQVGGFGGPGLATPYGSFT
jgi:hypothetical protein